MRNAFYNMMSQWFNKFMGANLATLQPPPPSVPPPSPPCPQNPILAMVHRPSIDKILKCKAEEFRGKMDVDPARAEYWLENTQQVFAELMCTPEDSFNCVVLLLKDKAYSQWNTLTTMVASDWVNSYFFQTEFRMKYVSRLYLERKKEKVSGVETRKLVYSRVRTRICLFE